MSFDTFFLEKRKAKKLKSITNQEFIEKNILPKVTFENRKVKFSCLKLRGKLKMLLVTMGPRFFLLTVFNH